ncbi:hypothetical protein TruAng_001015 [Truncatella angustata]|nr:hypothetical protein TruAng_001015 [Truncatella angustata]
MKHIAITTARQYGQSQSRPGTRRASWRAYIIPCSSDHGDAPRSTLHHRARRRPSIEEKARGQQYLYPFEEDIIVKYLLQMSDLGHPIRMKFIPSLAFRVTRHRPATERPLKPPGRNWSKALEKRHPELIARRVKAVDWNRHEKNIYGKIIHWFEVIKDVLQDPVVLVRNVYNMDETGVMLSMPGSVKVLVEWLKRVFDPETKEQANGKPRILIYDGFGTHETLEILELYFETNILLCRLPSHTSHKLQPCDVSVFAPLKAANRDQVDRLEQGGVNTIGKEHFTSLYSPARKRAFTPKKKFQGRLRRKWFVSFQSR